jgi:hypothetical protein
MRVDLLSLGSGAMIALLGVVILLDSSGAIDLSLGWLGVVLTGAVGAILLLSGLVGDGRSRHD